MNYQQARMQTHALRGHWEHGDESSALIHEATGEPVLRFFADGTWLNPVVPAKALINSAMPLGLCFFTRGNRTWLCGPQRQPLEIHGPVIIGPDGSVEPSKQSL